VSFSINISGHSNEKHNEAVQEAVAQAEAVLEAIPGVSYSLSGYSNDGEEITFSNQVAPPEPEAQPDVAASEPEPVNPQVVPAPEETTSG
jgi:flavin-binding protein dodecin